MFDISTTAAKILLKAGVVRFASTEASYFRLANNSLSPIYVDMRSLLGQPRPFDSIASLVAVHIQGMFPSLNERDAVVGIATGGIPYATLVANKLNMATGYIRKAAKEHGTGATLEGLGDPAPGSQLILLDDVTTDGQTKVPLIQAMRQYNKNFMLCYTIVDRNQGAGIMLRRDHHVTLYSLTTMNSLLNTAALEGFATRGILDQVREYLSDPQSWPPNLK
jgi:orotate phosphoribosyltransferase